MSELPIPDLDRLSAEEVAARVAELRGGEVDALIAHEERHERRPSVLEALYERREAIEEGVTGFLVEPENPAAFVAPILKLLRDPACQDAITAAAGRDLASKYSRDIHVRQICTIYDRLCPASATP